MLALSELLLILSVSALTATVAVTVLIAVRRAPSSAADLPAEPLMLLFDDGVLHHATNRALSHFAFWPGTHVWTDLRAALLHRFPDFPETILHNASGQITMRSDAKEDAAQLEISWRDRMCWVELSDAAAPAAPGAQATMQQLCCSTMADAVWEVTLDGAIGWRNPACDALLDEIEDGERSQVFQAPDGQGQRHRIACRMHDGSQRWFAVSVHRQPQTTLCHATCITDLVTSENAQNRFVQTLAKTFAHLSIGLAIFDRNGQLGIFNPALVDLTGLQPSYLATQPTMLSFFDQLRENRRMPEPKNYRNWRQEIAAVIAAASGGQYRETWTLEDGRTYSVQGRPHPDGATAFMIEDISPEITLTRNFRIEVEQYEALMDSVEDAFVVFSSTGLLTFCNAAYRRMWSHNPESAFADVTLQDAISIWEKAAGATADWQSVIRFVGTLGPRKTEVIPLRAANGKSLVCRLEYLASDASLLRFSTRPELPADSKSMALKTTP